MGHSTKSGIASNILVELWGGIRDGIHLAISLKIPALEVEVDRAANIIYYYFFPKFYR